MYLIVGLGNPGKEYSGTRHNVGFDVIDKLGERYNINISKQKYKALIGEGNIAGEKVVLVKPQTYMNLSGDSLVELMNFYKITCDNIIIVYDDTSIPTGQIRIRTAGSAGGHNGMKSIINRIKSDQFIRIRVGISEKPDGWDLADYVLSKFKKEELEAMTTSALDAIDAIEIMLKDSVLHAMNQFNKKNRGAVS